MAQHQIICHECDQLITMPATLERQHKLVCPRCHKTLTRGLNYPQQLVSALTITCILLLFLANVFPFLTFQAQGRSQSISLLQTASEIYTQGYMLMGVLIFLFIFLLPLIYLISLAIYTLLVKLKRLPNLSLELGKLITLLLPWCMADVFFTGVLVALIKIVAMAEIVFGVAFYSYLFFALAFLHLTQAVDLHRLWNWYHQAFEVPNER